MNDSSSNLTEAAGDQSLSTAMRLGGTIYYLLLIVAGTAGNLVAIVAIWTNRAMQKTRLVFIVLALSDTAVLLTNPPRYCILFLSGVDIREHDVASCKLHTFLTYLVKDVATWVLVLISLERLIATWAPYRLTKYHDSKVPVMIWSSVMVALLVKNASLLFVVTITTLPDGKRKLCDCETDKLKFRQAFMWLDSFVYCWLPSVCLFVFNGGILYALHRSRRVNIRKHQRSETDCRDTPTHLRSHDRALFLQLPGVSHSQSASPVGSPVIKSASRQRQSQFTSSELQPVILAFERDQELLNTETPIRKTRAMSLSRSQRNSRESVAAEEMTPARQAPLERKKRRQDGGQHSLATSLLIPISIFHLVTTLPIAVVSVVEAVLQIKHGSNQALTALIQTVGSVMVMLMCLNNALNCLVYFVSSQRFRQHFISLLRRRGTQRQNVRSAIGASANGGAFLGPLSTVYLYAAANSGRRLSCANGHLVTAAYSPVSLAEPQPDLSDESTAMV